MSEVRETKGGQLEITGIDTPLGEKAHDCLMTIQAANNAEDMVEKAKTAVVEQMEKDGMRSFNYEGMMFTITKEKVITPCLKLTKKVKKKSE